MVVCCVLWACDSLPDGVSRWKVGLLLEGAFPGTSTVSAIQPFFLPDFGVATSFVRDVMSCCRYLWTSGRINVIVHC